MSRKCKIYWGLWPFSVLYGIGVRVRNLLFDRGLLRQEHFPLPVICIGNLTVGGTGKTPHTEYLIRLLHESFRLAVLSRGYKRKSKGFVLASPSSRMEDIGDEPYQMARKFPDIHVAVDGDRCEGIRRLMAPEGAPDTEVVLLDDAFQHRYVQPGLSILLMDYHRPVECDQLLPAGRLREPASGKRRADLLVVTKCPPDLSLEACARIRQRIRPLPRQEVCFTTLSYGKLYPLFADTPAQSLDMLKEKEVLLVTGIASPAPLLEEVDRHAARVTPLLFGDHHNFDGADMRQIAQQFHRLPEARRLILTTEKDASRLIGHPQLDDELKPYIYVLPIEVEFLHKGELVFNPKIIEYVRKNSRNSRLPEGENAHSSRNSHHPGHGPGQSGA